MSAVDDSRTPLVVTPDKSRNYDMGRMRAAFFADRAETAGRYSISEWWLEPRTATNHVERRRLTPRCSRQPRTCLHRSLRLRFARYARLRLSHSVRRRRADISHRFMKIGASSAGSARFA